MPPAKLARLFRMSDSLTAVDVSANSLGPERVVAVSRLVDACASLKEFKLNDNDMRDEGALPLIGLLGERCPRLRLSG